MLVNGRFRAAFAALALLAAPSFPWQEPAPAAVRESAARLAGEAPGEAAIENMPAAVRAMTALLPKGETLHYGVEWRLIHAGDATLHWNGAPSNGSRSREVGLSLKSAGLVSTLYRVNNSYSAMLEDAFCATSVSLKAEEGSRRRDTRIRFDRQQGKAHYEERDLAKNEVISTREIDVPLCVHDVIGALYRLRSMKLAPGDKVELPVSDGKKSVLARVEAQTREKVQTKAGVYQTIRYEAHLFNNVLYRRKGRLYVWLTDDELRVPVQIRARLQFHIGTITFQLEKQERL